jgi:hypothetical protein
MSFSPAVSYPAGEMLQDVVTADFDRDGRPDLAVVDWWSGTVSVLRGNADGTFQPARAFATGEEPLSVAVGDFDGDGRLDLATANEYDVSVLRGNGDGTFRPPVSVHSHYAQAHGYAEPASVAVGDLNGDGAQDLVVTENRYDFAAGRYYGTATVLPGNGDGSFRTPIVNPLGAGLYRSAAVADFNGDGVPDLAAANGERSIVGVLLGDGRGNLANLREFPAGGSPWSVVAGDVNGDARADLVTANPTGSVGVLLGDGAGGFATARTYAAGGRPAAVVLGDFDRDGKPDIATANHADDSVSILRGHGDGSFLAAGVVAAGDGAASLAAGDFNGDGWLDLTTADNYDYGVSVLINDRSWGAMPTPSLRVGDATRTEGNTGVANALFTVTLSAPVSQPVTVRYVTSDGTALAGSDYQGSAGTLTFAPGQTTATITVPVTGDRVAEPNETFSVRLIEPTNASIADDVGVGTIVDDEPRLAINNATVTEGKRGTKTMTFTVTLSAAYDQAVTVNFATRNGTATAGEDYVARSGTLTFAPGETTKTFTVTVKGDRNREADETFYVDLFGVSANALIGVSRGTGTILDDDGR